MTGKQITPQKKIEALTLRAGGYTMTVISDRTGISVSSLKRLFKNHAVTKGKMKQEAIEQATEALMTDANAIEHIKREVSSLILDDIAIAKRIRAVIAEAADRLTASDTSEALQVMRAASAASVALKSTSETLRKSLGIDRQSDLSDELPELTIRIMTDQEIQSVKDKARKQLMGGEEDFYLTHDNEADDDLVEYS